MVLHNTQDDTNVSVISCSWAWYGTSSGRQMCTLQQHASAKRWLHLSEHLCEVVVRANIMLMSMVCALQQRVVSRYSRT